MNRHEFTRIYNKFYLFLESVVSPTAVDEEKGRDGGGILGCVEGGSRESGRGGGGILGASREAVGSQGEMVVGDAGEKHI
jgi:hypothetical protein